MPARSEKARRGPDDSEIAALDDLARRVRSALDDRPVVFGVIERGARVRFWGGPPEGVRPPAGPLSAYPTIEVALRDGVTLALSRDESVRFRAERAVVVPVKTASGSRTAVVLLGASAEDETPKGLRALACAVENTLRLVAERDDLRRRVGELGQSVSGFRALMEATGDAVKIVDLDGKVRAWNAGCESLYGRSAREAVGQSLPHVPPEARTGALAEMRRIAAMGEVVETEAVAERADGSRITVTLTAVPLRDADDLPAGIMFIARGVSSDSRLEQMQDDFLSLVTQELRNPLTAILGFTQLLSSPEIVADTGKRARTLRSLQARAQQMAAAIEDLLLASRIERGELRLDRAPTDLAMLVTETVTRFEQFQTTHRFVVDAETSMQRADVDPRRIEQAVTNLLSNAVKYSTGAEPVRVAVVRAEGDAAISVTDAGEGVPADETERVFDRFYKGQSARARPGAGLGLYLVRMIAEAHGGDVALTSKPLKGSTFTIRLPMTR
jgi:PAS domain S-box-containing protein